MSFFSADAIEVPQALFHFETLEVSLFCHRTWALPESPLDFLSVLLKFSLFEAVKNQSYIKLEPNEFTNSNFHFSIFTFQFVTYPGSSSHPSEED